eukprot:1184324-Prorocentrum_minimum.AAC.2
MVRVSAVINLCISAHPATYVEGVKPSGRENPNSTLPTSTLLENPNLNPDPNHGHNPNPYPFYMVMPALIGGFGNCPNPDPNPLP